MKVNGEIIKPMGKVNSGMPMEMFMKETGLMTRQMAMVFISMSTELVMRDIGKTTYKTVRESNPGLMVANMKDNTRKA